MARLVASTDADIVLFMDANVLVDPATIRTFERYFARPDIGSVAGTLKYINEGESEVASVGGLYWRIEEKIKQLETATGSTMGRTARSSRCAAGSTRRSAAICRTISSPRWKRCSGAFAA